MAVSASVQEFLRRSNVGYTVLRHPAAFSAQEEAAVTHIPGRDWAKVVTCFADGEPVLAVVPADLHVNLVELGRLIGAVDIRLAREDELEWLYPDCDRGAMPPFGSVYRQPVYVDSLLAKEPRIAFNAGTHSDAVSMRYEDFARIARPIIGRFAMQ